MTTADRSSEHTFVICAYKESPYLEACILSLKEQTVKSRIIMVTHTPCGFLQEMSEKYEIPLIVNHGEGGITQDWNFGISQAETQYVTVAHQDDVYFPDFLKYSMESMDKHKRPLITFTDYSMLVNGQMDTKSGLLRVKKFLLWPLRIKPWRKSRFIRRRVLSLGNPICCPAVTYNFAIVPKPVFENRYTSNEDWEAWEKMTKLKGSFAYVHKNLMAHRIHEESTTTSMIENNGRTKEDYEMFCKFWPRKIASWLSKVYSGSEKYNSMGEKV